MSTATRPAKTENKLQPGSTRFTRADNENEPKIDREGGRYESGIIRDVAVITRGEALGQPGLERGEAVAGRAGCAGGVEGGAAAALDG